MVRSAQFVFAVALAVSLGCSSGKNTVVILEIDSNFQVPGEIDKITVIANVPGRMTHELPFALGQKGQLPLRVGLLAPDGNPGGEITIVATGWKGADSLTHEDALVSFWKDQSRVIKLFLAKECLGFSACSAGQTCTIGPTCIRIRRDPDDGGAGDGAIEGVPSNTDAPPNMDVPPGTDAPASETGDGGMDACNCPPSSNPCLKARCEGGSCVTAPVIDLTTCPGGACWQGSCCTGCISANVCQPGTQVDACGGAGKSCELCDDKNPCTKDLCTASKCSSEKVTGGTCPAGVCVAGVCACGGQGDPCCVMAPACEGALACQGGTCGQCGAVGQDCCTAGNACASGLACGAVTKKCEPCGDLNQACCTAGTACRMGICGAANTCQPCGGFGQACCAGNSCAADGDLCNGNETCQNGTCGRSSSVVCMATDQCHTAGTCNPATGTCSNPVKTAGTPCNDGSMCTTGETCQNGACAGGAAVDCNDNNPCTVDSCATATGCAHPPAGGGTACATDNNPCTSDVCNAAGTCTHPLLGNGVRCAGPGGLNGVCSAGLCVECLVNADCSSGKVCRTNNTCCTPASNPCTGIICGTGFDGCGGSVACDTCPNGKICDRRCDQCLFVGQSCP
ncbi:MAG TPA: hypothetical protein VFH73_19310 [Polyangia bacterium]|nr:hypothetical protein [Polyangia bacterium]